MNSTDFRKYAHELADWIADYFETVEDYPVKPPVAPGEIYNSLPAFAPAQPESFETVFRDFRSLIMPGMTHWQHPKFFAYFPANNSFESVLGEMLTSALGAQCMVWQTSPAAAELEELVMNWLKDMLSLPADWSGVIQDTASTATLCSILTAREKFSNYEINANGFQDNKFTVYCSAEAHSSIEKAVKIAGIGKDNLRKIGVDQNYAMLPGELDKAIEIDIINGLTPLCVVAAFGTTSSTAIDPVKEIGEICHRYNIWLHIDAAFAGTALVLPEKRLLADGLEYADTFVFNPHKWMFTNFDCSAYFVKDKEALIRTFEIMPEYLKTGVDSHVNNYRDWGIQLGRRFRALKLWFVIRGYGVEGIRSKIREHISIAGKLETIMRGTEGFEVMAPVVFNTICFRCHPDGAGDIGEINKFNENLLSEINSDGRAFFTHTKLNGNYVIRFMIGQTYTNEAHVIEAWQEIKEKVEKLKAKNRN